MSVRGFRGEILSVAHDPRDHADAIRHESDGLLIVEDGIVAARGPHADLAPLYPGVAIEPLPGLIVPGFIDAHIHYPQMDRIASHGEQLLDWLDRHIFPAEKAFADRAHADAVATAFLTELLRNGTTSALVFATVHPQSVDALFEEGARRNMRIVAGKVLMDLGPRRYPAVGPRRKRGADPALAWPQTARLCGHTAFRADIVRRATGRYRRAARGASRRAAPHASRRKSRRMRRGC